MICSLNILISPNKTRRRGTVFIFYLSNLLEMEIDIKFNYNFCTNPFCKWCGQEQVKFETIKGKPSRYKLEGGGKNSQKKLRCNPDPINPTIGMTLNCSPMTVSNWSVAEEISRLVRINQTKDVEPEHNFHKDSCLLDT